MKQTSAQKFIFVVIQPNIVEFGIKLQIKVGAILKFFSNFTVKTIVTFNKFFNTRHHDCTKFCTNEL